MLLGMARRARARLHRHVPGRPHARSTRVADDGRPSMSRSAGCTMARALQPSTNLPEMWDRSQRSRRQVPGFYTAAVRAAPKAHTILTALADDSRHSLFFSFLLTTIDRAARARIEVSTGAGSILALEGAAAEIAGCRPSAVRAPTPANDKRSARRSIRTSSAPSGQRAFISFPAAFSARRRVCGRGEGGLLDAARVAPSTNASRDGREAVTHPEPCVGFRPPATKHVDVTSTPDGEAREKKPSRKRPASRWP